MRNRRRRNRRGGVPRSWRAAGLALPLLTTPLAALNDPLLERHIRGIETSGPPVLMRQHLLLSFAHSLPTRFVGARFAHEGFATLHLFTRNELGVFALPLEVPDGVGEVHYRIVVDGLWQTDPRNPSSATDERGVRFSVVALPDRQAPERPLSPEPNADGSLTFRLDAAPGRRITVVGNFTAWDPFLYPMEEQAPGQYAATLYVPPGRIYYYFTLDGGRLLDPLNVETASVAGLAVSSYLHGAEG